MSLHEPKRCRSCNQPIYWAKTERGKSMPVDAEPTPDGNVLLFDRGGTVIAKVLRCSETPPPGARLRVAHFKTCPDRDEWRKSDR